MPNQPEANCKFAGRTRDRPLWAGAGDSQTLKESSEI